MAGSGAESLKSHMNPLHTRMLTLRLSAAGPTCLRKGGFSIYVAAVLKP